MTRSNIIQARITMLRVIEQIDECLEYFDEPDEKQQETYTRISELREQLANYVFNESAIS